MRNLYKIAVLIALVVLAGCGKDNKQNPMIRVGYTNTVSFTGLFIAKDQGMFAKHGLDVELVPLALNSIIPSALAGGSIEIGGATPSVFLQAVDGGIDLVEVAGGAANDVRNKNSAGVLARTGADIRSPKDFEGKRVGVPGLGAYMHILFVRWLTDKGVDLKKVNFVEVPLGQASDILRTGNVDAVLAGEPFFSRIVKAGTGHMVAPYLTEMPDGLFAIYYTSRRDWALKNTEALKAFRAALLDGAAFMNKNPAKSRDILAKATHLPLDVVATSVLPRLELNVAVSDLDYWSSTLVTQGIVKHRADAAKLMIQ
jgi:NitT/TauT family transport system substrate-binding protein